MDINLHPSWQSSLKEEIKKNYFKSLSKFVREEYKRNHVYPEPKNIFRALNLCPLEEVKVVILGQDPYHGPNQANGLCFAVHEEIPYPPSLKNILKEMDTDLGGQTKTGTLVHWAKQGVLMLNSSLTVQAGQAGSHQKKGWEDFTDAIIKKVSDENEGVVFILWGRYAQDKGNMIDSKKHLIIKSPHPSPLSAHRGFFGSKPFSQTNEYLELHDKETIDWIGS